MSMLDKENCDSEKLAAMARVSIWEKSKTTQLSSH